MSSRPAPSGTSRPVQEFLRARNAWNRFYGFASYARSALWIVPLIAILVVLALAPALRALDVVTQWHITGLDAAGAQALYQTVITLALSFMVFTFGSLLVAIQVASGQLTPRIIATTLLRDNVVRFSVGLFVFSLVFSVMSLNRLENRVNELGTLLAALLGVACMANFLFLIDYAARLLRPVSIVARVCDQGLTVIEAVYPQMCGDSDAAPHPPPVPAAARLVSHVGNSGIVLAVDLASLTREAQRCDGVIELIPQVGDFVAYEEPLFALHGGAVLSDDRTLRAAVAFGVERTLEQDPLFAFRIIVDIALKALSPAINDPTTAVVAIDQVHRLLRAVGKRRLQGEAVLDARGDMRVVCRTPNWEDFVNVACHEIRCCGVGQVQVARRLRAMLDNLHASLPHHRVPVLDAQRDQLDRMVDTSYPLAEDRELARQPDRQGLGASPSRNG